MQRTKKSRRAKTFELKSGPEPPFPFLGKIAKGLGGGLLGKLLGKKNNAAEGGIVGGLAGDAAAGGDPSAATEQVEAIKAIVSDDDTIS